MRIKDGSVWMKKPSEWADEGGQLVIVEKIIESPTKSITTVVYRYTNSTVHERASRSLVTFLKRMELIKE